MKLGIILETNEPEKARNAIRFGNAAIKQGHDVQLFVMSAGVEAESIEHETFNVKAQLYDFAENKGVILACGTCIQGRHQQGSAMCPISTMIDCVRMVEWAGKVVTF